MAITYSTAAKNARLQGVVDTIDGGGGAGYILIGTSGMGTTLAKLSFAATSGTVSGGVLTFDTSPALEDTSADATGTAAAAVIYDFADVAVITGLTVGTSGTDIVLDSTSITAGQDIQITSATITHA